MEKKETSGNKALIDAMFKAGAHFAYSASRRHPSAASYIFGAKNKVEIFDLEKTSAKLEEAAEFLKKVVSEGKTVLFLGGKNESQDVIQKAAASLPMPYVAGRWIGGTLTNFGEIRKRIEKMETTIEKKEKGELGKYTKKERLLIDREVERLERFFSGLRMLKEKPGALFVIDAKKEKTAVMEAKKNSIPVVSLSSSDCNMTEIDYPIPGNDTAHSSLAFFVSYIANAIKEGLKEKDEKKKESKPSSSVVYSGITGARS